MGFAFSLSTYSEGADMMSSKCLNSGLTCRQLQISNTNRRLWTEHVLWTRFFIVSTTFNLPDLSAVTQRLLQNPVDFANELQPFYGRHKAMQFEKLFTEHLQIAAQLVNAAKAADAAEADLQRRRWYANAEDIAVFLGSINPFWSVNVRYRLCERSDPIAAKHDAAGQMTLNSIAVWEAGGCFSMA